MVEITQAEVVRITDINIETAAGIITDGYTVRVTVKHSEKETTEDTINLLVVGKQSPDWCRQRCERVRRKALSQKQFTVGQFVSLFETRRPLTRLGL